LHTGHEEEGRSLIAVRFMVALACAGLLTAAGCGATPEVTIHNPAGYVQMPEGPCAVLEVTARPMPAARSFDFIWGVVHSPRERESFAEILSHVARTEGGLDVLSPAEVDRRLKLAKLEANYEPTPEQLAACVMALGCGSYLSAHIEEWRYTYFLMRSAARVRMVVALHVPGRDAPLWWVRVEHEAPGMDEREVAGAALREAFRTLNRFRQVPAGRGK
jgi:hypothetical protein